MQAGKCNVRYGMPVVAASIVVGEGNNKTTSNTSQEKDTPFEDGPPQPAALAPLIPPDQRPCPECDSQIVEGWLPDYAGQPVIATRWHPGSAKASGGLLLHQPMMRADAKATIPVRAFRCVRCGFLKLYARDVG